MGCASQSFTRHLSGITYLLIALGAAICALSLLAQVQAGPKKDILSSVGSTSLSTTLEIYLPLNRHDDLYALVDVSFNDQRLPMSIDTSIADTFVASDQCDVLDPTSGCYALENVFSTKESVGSLLNETFDMFIGKGRVIGNLSIASTQFGRLKADNTTIALIDQAMPDEFLNGSFAGVLGLGLRSISQTWARHWRLPIFDSFLSQGALTSPLFSIRYPRYGDPAARTGALTIGKIEQPFASLNISYEDVASFSRDLHKIEDPHLFAWSAILQGIRINGVEIKVTPGRVRPDQVHVSVIDSGASYIYLRTQDFVSAVAHLKATTVIEPDSKGDSVLFECDIPQLLELKFRDRWFPVDPLDILEPYGPQIINGIEMLVRSTCEKPIAYESRCRPTLRTWDSTTFGDSLMGLPFQRSVFSVFDYVSSNMFSVPPRLGMISTVDTQSAMRRYKDLYSNRLQ